LGIFERYLPEIARNVSVITGDKKEELLESMLKIVAGETI
jgi:DNA topoisomerase VI subunit B